MLRLINFAVIIFSCLAIETEAAELTVTVTSAKPASGQILVSVFDAPRSWMKRPVASETLAISSDGIASATFGLEAGAYAIALIHDVNANGKMDTNGLGIPTEAFGFSNRARARFGPPSFNKAAFDLPKDGARVTISLDRRNR